MHVITKLILGVLLASVLHKILLLLWTLGFHKRLYDHTPGPCRHVAGIDANGSEDIQTLSGGLAFISSGFKAAPMLSHVRDRKGQIFLFDFNQPLEPARPLPIDGNVRLNSPLGIAVWEDELAGVVTLFVIDQYDTEHDRIEKFLFDRERRILRHQKTITSDNFWTLNNIVATSASTFYATNALYSKKLFVIYVELLLILKHGTVVYYDGETARHVATGLCHPNGIALSPDNRYVYMSAILCQELVIFDRHDDNVLTVKEVVALDTCPDNLWVSRDSGDVWLAADPVFWQFAAAISDPSIPTPSQVLRLKVQDGRVSDIFEVFMDTGKMIYASSVANYYKGAMLIGSVYDRLLYCEVKHMD